MLARFVGAQCVWLVIVGVLSCVWADQPSAQEDVTPQEAAPQEGAPGEFTPRNQDVMADPEPADSSGQQRTRVNKGSGVLPNDQGQVWREYDISPYTSQVGEVPSPQQAIIDWILRETGTEVWFSDALGLLHADYRTLRVYHTPEMQRTVADVVERFNRSSPEPHVLGIRLVTIGNPNWRSKAYGLLKPVSVQSPGVDAWLLSRENATLLLAQLSKRTDYREHNAVNLKLHNGQSQTLTRTRPRNFIRWVHLRPEAFPGHELEMGEIEQGYSMQISPLMASDETMMDAVIKCSIDQVEKLVPIVMDVPQVAGQKQRAQIHIPQLVSWRLHERFRWPADHVLVLSCGVVASPAEDRPTPLNISNPFQSGGSRGDALLFLDSQGKVSQTLEATPRTALDPRPNHRTRY